MLKAYVAYDKETGKALCGARGDYVFGDLRTLRCSLGQHWMIRDRAFKQGKKPKDLYIVKEYDLKDGVDI